MKIIAIANNKGGVGKTKLCSIIIEYLAIYKKKRVLAIDLDPQCNLSKRYIPMVVDPSAPEGFMPPLHPDIDLNDPDFSAWSEQRSSIADIFFGLQIVPYNTQIANLEITPGHASRLLEVEAIRRNEITDKVYNHLANFLDSDDLKQMYDAIVIDTGPSKGPLTVSAIRAATHMIIPSIMEELPIQGIYGMMQLWKQESLKRGKDRPLELVGIIANQFRKISLHEGMFSSLLETENIAQYVIPHKIGQRAAFAEVDTEGAQPTTIFNEPNSSKAKEEAIQVCDYVAKKVFNG